MSTSETNGENVIFSRDGQNEPSAGQWDDAELIRMFERSTAKNIVDTNNAGAVASVQQTQEVKSWKVGDSCMAPYELDGKWYPASIESIAKGKGTCKVLFSGYEERATVKMDQLMTESDVEYAGDNTDPGQEEFEETGDKIARDEATSADNPANGKESGSGFPLPDLCPPPPPALFGKIALASSEKDALTNMLMSWYMSGYHTGFYQGVMQEKMSNQK